MAMRCRAWVDDLGGARVNRRVIPICWDWLAGGVSRMAGGIVKHVVKLMVMSATVSAIVKFAA